MATSTVLPEIEGLDPTKDYQRICYLSVTHDFPFDFLAATEVGLFKAFCIPALSELMHRSGQIVGRPRSRLDNTLTLFVGFYEYGLDSPEGRAALRFTNRQHQPFAIGQEAYRYALSAAVMEPIRFNRKYGWRRFHENEKQALFYFWRQVGRMMNVREYFDSLGELERYFHETERREFRFTPANRELAEAQITERLSRVDGRFNQYLLRNLFLTVLGKHAVDALGIERPHPVVRALSDAFLTARAAAVRELFPRRATPKLRTQMPSPSYPQGFSMERVVAETPPSRPIEAGG